MMQFNLARKTVALAAAALAVTGGAAHAAGVYVNFLPGTYDLASEINSLPPYPEAPDQILVVTVSSGTATFDLSGAETASFTLPNDAEIATSFDAGSVLFSASAAGSPTWDTTAYPYITFWSAKNFGGFTIGSIPGDLGSNIIDNFASTDGPGVVFSAVPEPAGWAVMLVGLAGLGVALRSKRRVAPATA